ncbi:citrate synthase family protein [Lacibacterium aquatile]|uniref:citrate synthase (unknown stereospecificity) n=1 Tax=Lacibacterium aquatile TaxID=1168082 RepID=A0ABW5DSJ7_9PROT
MSTLSAKEAAALLGVTPQTLYSYVSRGLLKSFTGPDERASRYSREAVEQLARTRRLGRRPKEIAKSTLDWGVPVLESSLTLIEEERLYFQGQDAVALARTASLEDAAALLWQIEDAFTHPAPEATASFESRWSQPPSQPFPAELLSRFVLACDQEAAWEHAPGRLAEGCGRLVRLMAASALGQSPAATPIHRQCAVAWGLRGWEADLIRQALVLCADHELNASSFTARCITSTGASLQAALIGGLAALSGGLHGGLTARVETFWRSLEGVSDLEGALREQLASGMEIPGFGHPLYPNGDIRAQVILADVYPRLPQARAIAEAVTALTGKRPALDFSLVALRRMLKLPEGAAFALFALGRSVGWIAQALEQRQTGALIRPRAVYVGPRP